MLLRFVTDMIDLDSGRRRGVITAAYPLARSAGFAPHDRDRLWSVLGWFEANLRVPGRLALSRRPHARPRGLCWFRDSAAEHVARAHELAGVLRENDLFVEVIRTTRPGYVLAEDAFQVAAYPFADTPA